MAQLNISLSTFDRGRIQAAADAAGLPVSSYARRVILGQGVDGGVVDDERMEDFERRLARLEELAERQGA